MWKHPAWPPASLSDWISCTHVHLVRRESFRDVTLSAAVCRADRRLRSREQGVLRQFTSLKGAAFYSLTTSEVFPFRLLHRTPEVRHPSLKLSIYILYSRFQIFPLHKAWSLGEPCRVLQTSESMFLSSRLSRLFHRSCKENAAGSLSRRRRRWKSGW